MLSVIIPSFKCKFTSRTVQDILEHATGEIEIIVILDAYQPFPPIPDNPKVVVVYKGTQSGMRKSINLGALIAKGEYIMKCDDHCSFSQGFDEQLVKSSEAGLVQVPSRYMLDVEAWQRRREAIEYEYMTYPYRYLDKVRYGMGLHSKKWLGEKGFNPPNMGPLQFYYRENARRGIKIDEIMVIHGSCWFMPKIHFFNIGGLEESLFSSLYQEPQEVVIKTWLSGGRCVVNKNVWYAHMHKASTDGPTKREYELDLHAMRETERLGSALWMNDKWSGATKPMKWMIEKFWPIPEWPEGWERQKIEWEKKYPVFLEDKYELRGV